MGAAVRTSAVVVEKGLKGAGWERRVGEGEGRRVLVVVVWVPGERRPLLLEYGVSGLSQDENLLQR